MAEDSKIQWTRHTFNPWRGCTKVSAGCANCYAETLSGRNPKTLGVWGPKGTRVVASESMWRQPLKWDNAAAKAGERHRVFCASLADVFEGPETMPADARDAIHAARLRLFALIERTPHLDWLLLTKRPQLIPAVFRACVRATVCPHEAGSVFAERWLNSGPPANVWLGTSVEDQSAADERIPHLLRVPAAVRFLSCEPLLGPLRLDAVTGNHPDGSPFTAERPYLGSQPRTFNALQRGIGWVIVGGESGPDPRPFRTGWARDIVRQCQEAGVPVFVKQLGENATTTLPDGEVWPGHGPTTPPTFSGNGFGHYQILGLKDKKGGDPAEWPADLRVRQFPEVPPC